MTRRLSLLLALLLVVGLVPPAMAAPGAGPLPVPEVEENVDLPPGLTPYHEIAPKLNVIARSSNRVRVDVAGTSADGRDLYTAIVSDPLAGGRFDGYLRLRRLMLHDPDAALELIDDYDVKVPLFINCSIHGNEWEGTDACLDQIERLASSDEPDVLDLLAEYIIVFNVVSNPDGRVQGTRRNGNGFDLNRDMLTTSQPEARVLRDLITRWNPMVLLDLHGYVGPGGLIEPCTPPHNPNYEYDLYIEGALDMGKAMRDSAEAASGARAEIPYLDFDQGWDDWPPIFVPMYAMFHGAYGHTIESPFRVNGSEVDLPLAERTERSERNRAFHNGVVEGMFAHVVENKADLLRDQIEIFRRGAAAAQPVPLDPDFEGVDFLDTVPEVEYPDGYVIPAGEGQDAIAAAVLVEHLVAHDVEVGKAQRAFSADGRSFARGDYVVDMAQPKRGLANTMLELGYDISELVDLMYDISGWSLSELWGAQVVRIEDGLDVRTRQVRTVRTGPGTVPSGVVAAYGLPVETPEAVQAVTGLLSAGIDLWRTPDGVVHVPASAKSAVNRLAGEGLSFSATNSLPDDAAPLTSAVIGSDLLDDEEFVLRNLGFELVDVTTDAVNGGEVAYDEVDVIATSDGDFDYRALSDQPTFDDWIVDGGGIVTRGRTGAFFNDDAGLLDVGFTSAESVVNGVVAVDTDPGSPVLAPNADEPTSFVYRPVWFTDLGDGVRADQRYGTDDLMLAGHWPTTFGPQVDEAKGQAAVVSGTVGEGRVVAFGTEPLFRSHPRELFVEFANALLWAAAEN